MAVKLAPVANGSPDLSAEATESIYLIWVPLPGLTFA